MKNRALEDTAISNIFIADILPDVPDADYARVYIYAYMCVCSGEEITHLDLADRLAVSGEKVIAAWKYFESRKAVKLSLSDPENPYAFEVLFIDLRSKLYAGDDPGPSEAHLAAAKMKLEDSVLKALLARVAQIAGTPAMTGDDALKIAGWLTEQEATPELIEYAYKYSRDTAGHTRTDYIAKVVKTWTEKGFKNGEDAGEYLAATDKRYSFYKELMGRLGMKYMNLTQSEKDTFDLWLGEYGFSPDRLLELADKTAGTQNKFRYLSGIIERERRGEGKTSGAAQDRAQDSRAEKYREEREKNEDEQSRRTAEIYEKLPEVKKIDDELAFLRMELVKTITGGRENKSSVTARTNAEMEKRLERRRAALREGGFPEDYTDNVHTCDRCKDTGKLENGADCGCQGV